MTRTEVELISALVLIYISDCIYWIDSADQVFTRVSDTNWKSHRTDAKSFTLLKKTPVVSDPFLIHPGFIRHSRRSSRGKPPTVRELRKIAKRMCRLWVMETQCRLQGILLLIGLPWIVWTGRLAELWPAYLVTLLISHAALVCSLSWFLHKSHLPQTSIVLLVINPVGAIRLLDGVSQLLYNQASEDRK